MSCHNCGHTGTFVLLAQFALAVGDADYDCSLAVQCPACDSTDVGLAPADLLARHGSNTTS